MIKLNKFKNMKKASLLSNKLQKENLSVPFKFKEFEGFEILKIQNEFSVSSQ